MHDLLERIGIGWVRFENLKWPFVSAEKGVFDYRGAIGPWHVDHDAMFASYRAHGLHILPYLFLTQDYAAPPGVSPASGDLTRPPKDFAQYAEFVFQTVARYGSAPHPPAALKTADKRSGLGWIDVFELWNEPNLDDPSWGHWKGPIERYYDMFRLGAEAAKRADPNARVANGGFSGIGVELVDTLRSYAYADSRHPLDFVDVLSVHFYTGRSSPETARVNVNTGSFGDTDPRTLEENLVRLSDWRDRHKPGMPIWLTETGYETAGAFGIDERMQAAWLVRDVLLMLANGIEKVMVFREMGSDAARWGSAGVLRSDRSLKPSLFTYAALAREMDGVEGAALRLPAADDNVRIHAWKRNGGTLLTAWAVEGTTPFPLDLGAARVTDSFGFRRTVETSGLRLTAFPVFIRDVTDAAPLDARIARARADEEERQRRIREEAGLRAYLFDFGSREKVGAFVIGDVRRCTPVVARDIWDDGKAYGFTPSAALQDDDQAWLKDPLKRDACRLGRGIGFRFRAVDGAYLLRACVVPFEPRGRLTIDGAGETPIVAEVTRPEGLAEVEVRVNGRPLTLEMDGYASLAWIALIERPPVRDPSVRNR
ncbi:MAG: hypothetical protein JXP34_07065 [Planctomycetes bacterium]|nr:hypothetical protein [Planctomycetota bacterium]